MGAILNGLTLHGGLPRLRRTFLIFSDYMRPAVRLACSWACPSIYVWTHDSIGLGEDGPTHQPIEHLATLRAMPSMRVIRPADANETVEAWRVRWSAPTGPSGSRSRARSCPCSTARYAPAERRAARRLRPGRRSTAAPDVILIARAPRCTTCWPRARRSADGVGARVVSLPELEPLRWPSRRPTATRCCRPRLAPRVARGRRTFGWSALVGDRGTAWARPLRRIRARRNHRARARHHARGRRGRGTRAPAGLTNPAGVTAGSRRLGAEVRGNNPLKGSRRRLDNARRRNG